MTSPGPGCDFHPALAWTALPDSRQEPFLATRGDSRHQARVALYRGGHLLELRLSGAPVTSGSEEPQ